MPARGDSCGYANDGVCDEPADCELGTDAFDCGNRPRDNSCALSRDGSCDEPERCAFGTDSADCCAGSGLGGDGFGATDVAVVVILIAIVLVLVRRLVRRSTVARRQIQTIAADGEIAQGGMSYGGWYLRMVVLLFATTLPIWIAGVVLPIHQQRPRICNHDWSSFPLSGAYYWGIFFAGLAPAFLVLIFGLAYQKAGCCGGGGLVRLKSSLPPVATEAGPTNERVVAASLRRDRQSWFERTFYPILLLEELERRPPRRPAGAFKVKMPRHVAPGKIYTATTFSGRAYFTVPEGTRGGDLVWVRLPDTFADGSAWGDNAHTAGELGWLPVPVTMGGSTIASQTTRPVFSGAKAAVREVLEAEAWSAADMSTLRGQVTRVNLIKESGHPRMTVVTASTLRAMKRIPRSSEGCAQDLGELLMQHGPERKMTPCGDPTQVCGRYADVSKETYLYGKRRLFTCAYLTQDPKSDKPGLVVVFFSHSWIRKVDAHPDDAAGHKAMAMVQFADWLIWSLNAQEKKPLSVEELRQSQEVLY